MRKETPSPPDIDRWVGRLQIDGERLWNTLMEMARIGATPAGGCNRQALTPADANARALFRQWCEAAGCSVRTDAVGNLFARRSGTDPTEPVILIGSHLDTQPTGGKYDGVYGVLAGLEVVRTLNDHHLDTRSAIDLAVWTNEEGARFAPAMLGSGVWAGEFPLTEAYQSHDADGVTLEQALRTTGQLGDEPAKPYPIRRAFELHIEQGPILESLGKQIGIVSGVQGIRWYDLTIEGQACHAGPTPMGARRDPVKALGALLQSGYELIERHGPDAASPSASSTPTPDRAIPCRSESG